MYHMRSHDLIQYRSSTKASTSKQKKPNKSSSVDQSVKHKQKKTGRKDGSYYSDCVMMNYMASLVR